LSNLPLELKTAEYLWVKLRYLQIIKKFLNAFIIHH
jgi:hypothetical protein